MDALKNIMMETNVRWFVVGLLLTTCLVGDSESFLFKIPIHKICRKVCNRVCDWVIDEGFIGKFICRFSCRHICGKSKCQGALEETSHVTPLPSHFEFYDLDGNRIVYIEEFASTLGHQSNETGLIEGFHLTDINNDGKLSIDEFYSDTSAFYLVNTADTSDPKKSLL